MSDYVYKHKDSWVDDEYSWKFKSKTGSDVFLMWAKNPQMVYGDQITKMFFQTPPIEPIISGKIRGNIEAKTSAYLKTVEDGIETPKKLQTCQNAFKEVLLAICNGVKSQDITIKFTKHFPKAVMEADPDHPGRFRNVMIEDPDNPEQLIKKTVEIEMDYVQWVMEVNGNRKRYFHLTDIDETLTYKNVLAMQAKEYTN